MSAAMEENLLARIKDAATWVCDSPADETTLAQLPADLAQLLQSINGFILFDGGLHLRGAVSEPPWHSLQLALRGEGSFASRYSSVAEFDMPFSQDCLGNQFLLRNDEVFLLSTETDELEDLKLSLPRFLELALNSPDELLVLTPLQKLQADGGGLAPGELIHVYPPFCIRHDGQYSLRPTPAEQCLASLAKLAREARDLPDGTAVRVEPPGT